MGAVAPEGKPPNPIVPFSREEEEAHRKFGAHISTIMKKRLRWEY